MASKKIFLPLVLGALLALFIGLTIFGDNGLLHLAGSEASAANHIV